MPTVRTALGTEPYAPHRIVAALIEETGLLPEEAERVAERVGDSLARAALSSVSTSLVRELVSHELLALGLPGALERHEAIGIPRYDLLRLFESADATAGARPVGRSAHRSDEPRRFDELVSSALIGRWAASDVLSEAVAEAHARADISVLGLGCFHAPLARSVPGVLLMPRSAPIAAAPLVELGARAGELARGAAFGLFIEGADDLLGPDDHGDHADHDARADTLVASLSAAARVARRSIDLSGFALSDGGSALASLMAALHRFAGLNGQRGSDGSSVRWAPRLFLDFEQMTSAIASADAAESERHAQTLDGLVAAGLAVPVWSSPEGGRWAGPALHRQAGDAGALALDAACAINLPRLARRAGPWREDAFLEALHALMPVAVKGLVERGDALARSRRAHGEPIAERGRFGFIPVGLREALAILGDGLARADQGARILAFMTESAERCAQQLGGAGRTRPAGHEFQAVLTSAYGGAAARRFASSDAASSSASQPRLFDDLPRPEDEVAASYRTSVGSLATSESHARLVRRSEAMSVLLGGLRAGELWPESGSFEGTSVVPAPGALGAPARRRAAPTGRAGVPQRDESAPPEPEIESEGSILSLGQVVAKRPRLAAWSRFAAMRPVSVERALPGAETTLF